MNDTRAASRLPQNKPIGVFDSGVGGLTVVKALAERLPRENLVYFGDTARVPYGGKSASTIARYANEIISFLLAADVKALVIACNSISAVAAEDIRRDRAGMPVLDVITAGAKTAAAKTKNKRVGVVGTIATVDSQAYPQKIKAIDPDVAVSSAACPLFVPLVEEGWVDDEVTAMVARRYLDPIAAQGVDTLVLGCTHYPLLRPLLQRLYPGLGIVDSAVATAQETFEKLQKAGLLNDGTQETGRRRFVVSDRPQRFRETAELFLGESLGDLEVRRLEV